MAPGLNLWAMLRPSHRRFPQTRLRRLRQSPALRQLVRETALPVEKFVLPVFVREGTRIRRPIAAMPNVYQYSADRLLAVAEEAQRWGIPALLIFGIPETKDAKASGAYASGGVVQRAVQLLKRKFPRLIIITDVCLCEYMEHGHCGLIERGAHGSTVANDATLKLLQETAVSHAEAGADIVAPSDMMDGRIGAIRSALDDRGLADLPILAYAAKFASAFYSPFREAAESAPQFGDRQSYQMDPGNALEALHEVALDIEEGADIVMVKPALAYLDILYRVKSTFGLPTAAYAVSGEYAMVKAAALKGWVDENKVLYEMLLGIRRAGADIIITYAAIEMAKWLKKQT